MRYLLTYLFTALFLLGGVSTFAQQLPQISMFQDNYYVLNPAYAGSAREFQVFGMNRTQWTGITDAPRTFSLSLQGQLKNPHVGVGGHLFTDNVGPTRRTGIQLSYTYHFFINEKIKIGLGLSGGMLQFAIDGTKISLKEEGDPALYSELRSQTVFDATFGAYAQGENWWAGFTLPQLLQNQIRLYDSVEQASNRLEDHYLIAGGYKYALNSDFTVEPAILLKYVKPTPLKWELSARFTYQDMVWLGASFRSNDAAVLMAGYEYRNAISIGYAYDLTTSSLRDHTTGTHEILVGFRFNQ
jgi:type IX secretion system PorP/SprF family membrane protein